MPRLSRQPVEPLEKPGDPLEQPLHRRGYRVIPVNPNCEELFGGRCYPTLAEAAGAGLTVVIDRCPAIEIPRLGIDGPSRTAVE